MRQLLAKRLARLLCVKSIVTLALTAVFVALALRGDVSQDFMTIYSVIVAFYFGTQIREGDGGRDREGTNGDA